MRQEQCIQLRILVTTAAFCLVSCAPAKPTEQPEDEGNGVRTEPDRSETNQGEGGEEAGEDDKGDAAGDSKSDTRAIEVQTRDAKPCEPLQDKQKRAGDQTSTPAYETFRSSAQSQGTRTQASDALRTVFRVPKKYRGRCASWLDAPAPNSEEPDFEGDCTVEFQRGGEVAVIYQTTFCGGDACSVRYFLVIEDVEVPDTHTVYTRPQWGDFPDEVRFLGERKVEYEISLEEKPAGGGEVEQRVETFVWPSEESDTSGEAD